MRMDLDARAQLERWIKGATTPQRLVRRSRIALLVLDGESPDEIAVRVGVSRPTVALWKSRFEQGGPHALTKDAPGRGRHATVHPETLIRRLEDEHLLGPNGRPRSLRRAAAALGVSVSALWRALRKPYLSGLSARPGVN
jgi:transposase